MGVTLTINETQDIMQEDQRLFEKTVAELKNKEESSLLDLLDSGQDREPYDDKSSGE